MSNTNNNHIDSAKYNRHQVYVFWVIRITITSIVRNIIESPEEMYQKNPLMHAFLCVHSMSPRASLSAIGDEPDTNRLSTWTSNNTNNDVDTAKWHIWNNRNIKKNPLWRVFGLTLTLSRGFLRVHSMSPRASLSAIGDELGTRG